MAQDRREDSTVTLQTLIRSSLGSADVVALETATSEAASACVEDKLLEQATLQLKRGTAFQALRVLLRRNKADDALNVDCDAMMQSINKAQDCGVEEKEPEEKEPKMLKYAKHVLETAQALQKVQDLIKVALARIGKAELNEAIEAAVRVGGDKLQPEMMKAARDSLFAAWVQTVRAQMEPKPLRVDCSALEAAITAAAKMNANEREAELMEKARAWLEFAMRVQAVQRLVGQKPLAIDCSALESAIAAASELSCECEEGTTLRPPPKRLLQNIISRSSRIRSEYRRSLTVSQSSGMKRRPM